MSGLAISMDLAMSCLLYTSIVGAQAGKQRVLPHAVLIHIHGQALRLDDGKQMAVVKEHVEGKGRVHIERQFVAAAHGVGGGCLLYTS